MKLRTPPRPVLPGVTGPARVDRRLADVVRRAGSGDVVVLDHLDLDRAGAEDLLARGVVAVVDAAPLISGRYPNLGPEVLAAAGVALVDDVGAQVFERVRDGAGVRIDGGQVYADEQLVATGRALTLEDVHRLKQEARDGLATQLQSLAHTTSEFLRREQPLLLHGEGVPDLEVEMAGRPVVVVERGFAHGEDLRNLRRFVREQRPVLVGVDAGADVLLSAGLTPSLVVVGEQGLAQPQPGTATSSSRAASDRALSSAAEVLVHAGPTGRVPGSERLERLGVRAHRITAAGATADVALLVADAENAAVIVTVGSHAGLEEFLDRQRTGLASTLLTRLRTGPRLIDAALVPELYTGRVRRWQLALLLVAGLVAVAAAIATTPVGSGWFRSAWDAARDGLDAVPPWGDRVQGWWQGLTG